MTLSIFQFGSPEALAVIILSKELDHSKKSLINIQNIHNNEYYKRRLVRYLHPVARIRKVNKDFVR